MSEAFVLPEDKIHVPCINRSYSLMTRGKADKSHPSPTTFPAPTYNAFFNLRLCMELDAIQVMGKVGLKLGIGDN